MLSGLLLSLAVAAPGAVPQPRPAPWNVIAGSDVILVGTIADVIEDPVSAHDPRISDSRSGNLDIIVQKTLKGHAAARLRASYFVSVGWSDALLGNIKDLSGKPAIFYMLVGPDHETHGLWFDMPAVYGASVLTADSPEAEQHIRDELAREPLQGSEAALYLAKLDGGVVESQVQAAIDDMASGIQPRIDAGENRLQKLGCDGLPYIVKHMDDRRPFRGIVKGPSSWEAYAQYGAKQMSDALVIVLGQIADPVRPERDEFDIDDAERRKMIDAWLLYIAHHRAQAQSEPMALDDMCKDLRL